MEEMISKLAVDRLTTVSDLLLDTRLSTEKSKVSQIFEKLRALVVEIKLLPGQQVSELEVAEALATSKTPVREALIRLEHAGLVKIVPKSGTYVTPIRIDRYLEACFIRANLEIGAVRKAAQRSHSAPGSFCDLLDSSLSRQQAALACGDDRAFFLQDDDFHRAFFELAGVPGVWRAVKRVQTDVDRVRHLRPQTSVHNGAQIIDQHRAIRDAIDNGNPADAETALLDHIGQFGSEIETLSRQPGLLERIESLNAAVRRPPPQQS